MQRDESGIQPPLTEADALQYVENSLGHKIDVLCRNCSHIIWFRIPKGITMEEYFDKNKLCPQCNCEHGRAR